jgi:hypothetical protein
MDHQAFAQLLGNYGEFVSAIAVVLTLAYLAFQIRQNTKTLRASIYTSWVEGAAITHQMITDNAPQYAELLEPDCQIEDLSSEAQIVLETWFTHTFNLFEAAFLHHMEGSIDDSIFDAKRRNMITFLDRPVMRMKWQELSEGIYDRRFIDFVNSSVMTVVATSPRA